MPRHSPRSLKTGNRHPMNHAQIRQHIEAHVTRQPGTKIQYGHPSPRFWSPLSLPPADVAAMRVKNRGLVLYLHIPFCPKTDPPACGFCLFAREDYTGYEAVEVYLSYMLRELAGPFAPPILHHDPSRRGQGGDCLAVLAPIKQWLDPMRPACS